VEALDIPFGINFFYPTAWLQNHSS
jgi:hypothetical protein